MLSIDFTGQYLKDLKLARKRNLDEQKLNEVLFILVQEQNLPAKYKDHSLSGNFKGFRECHILPDWLLIYSIDAGLKVLRLVRTGTHSDLFR